MRDRLVRKGLVVGIIILFLGASILPMINGDARSMYVETVKGIERALQNTDQNIVSSSSSIENKLTVNNHLVTEDIPSDQKEQIMERFNSASMYFTENKGQFPEEVLFQTHALGATIYLCKNKVVSVFTREAEGELDEIQANEQPSFEHKGFREQPQEKEMISVVTEFIGVNKNGIVNGEQRLTYNNNYFIGNNPEQWYTDVPNYQEVVYESIYPGIDLRYHFIENTLKYDFIVYSGGNLDTILIRYDGVDNMRVTPDGDIAMETRFGMLSEKSPVIFQEINGIKQGIMGRYELRQPNSFGFTIEDEFNPLYPLVIDPTLAYSTYLGGTNKEEGFGIAVDGAGSAYVTGYTESFDFPVVNPYDGTFNGGWDVFVSKLSPPGNTLVYSTYLGGTGYDFGYSIAVDGDGNAYIAGGTSSDFPVVNPYDGTWNGGYDAFVTKLSTAGNTLVYSTYLGGYNDDWGISIAIDNARNAYITGTTESFNFPVVNSYDSTLNGGYDAFVSKLSYAGNILVYSTYLGGINGEEGRGIAVDDAGNAYITGGTWSFNFPVVNPYDGTFNGGYDAFVSKIDPSKSGVDSLIYSTYLGGTNDDQGESIRVDGDGNAYITGYTDSSDFPVVNPYDGTWNGGYDAFVSKLSPPGNTLLYSTYLGGTNDDRGHDIAVDDARNAYIAGGTASFDFPTTPDAYDTTYNGGGDAFVSIIDPSKSGVDSLIYSTYLGGSVEDLGFGIAVDGNRNAYTTGYTESFDFPVVNPYDGSYNGNGDAFVAKFTGGNNDLLDQSQDIWEGGYALASIQWLAQSFKPSLGTLTRIELLITRGPTTSYSVKISIRDNLLGSDIVSVTLQPEAFPVYPQIQWTEIDLPDIYVVPEETYYIVCTTNQPFGDYNWWGRGNNPYERGQAYFSYDQGSSWANSPTIDLCFKTYGIENQPPNKPVKPSGSTNGRVGVSYTYSSSTTDPDGDQLYYWFDWGDGTNSGWVGPLASGATASASQSWSTKDTYNITVKARDTNGAESVWSDPLSVTIPRTIGFRSLFLELLERFPNLFLIIRHIMGL